MSLMNSFVQSIIKWMATNCKSMLSVLTCLEGFEMSQENDPNPPDDMIPFRIPNGAR